MMTVRFPNGQAVQYNTANFMRYCRETYWEIYTADPAKGGSWIASIGNTGGVIVEVVAPCRVYNGMHNSELSELTREVKAIRSKIRKGSARR